MRERGLARQVREAVDRAGELRADLRLQREEIAWDMVPSDWLERACQLPGRNLTPVEWARYLPGQPYRETCG